MRNHLKSFWITLVIFSLASVTTGCTVRRTQSAVQSSLTSMAHGLDATSDVAAEQLGDAPAQARAYVLDQRSQNPGMSVDAAMELYRERLEQWYALSEALTMAHHILLVGQTAVNLWISTGDLPGQWGEFCDSVEQVMADLVGQFERLEIEVPELLGQALPYTGTVCEMASAFFTQEE